MKHINVLCYLIQITLVHITLVHGYCIKYKNGCSCFFDGVKVDKLNIVVVLKSIHVFCLCLSLLLKSAILYHLASVMMYLGLYSYQFSLLVSFTELEVFFSFEQIPNPVNHQFEQIHDARSSLQDCV